MGNVYQTLAYLYETLLFMQTSTGFGQVVVTGATDSFILHRATRDSLRRWCSFVAIHEALDDEGEFILEEEEADDVKEDGDSDDGNDAGMQTRTQLRYEYVPPDARREGSFRLLPTLRS